MMKTFEPGKDRWPECSSSDLFVMLCMMIDERSAFFSFRDRRAESTIKFQGAEVQCLKKATLNEKNIPP